MNTLTEENYLKAIYKLSERQKDNVNTNDIARVVDTAPASVTDMLKKLSQKKLIHYAPYKGVSLTTQGRRVAVSIIRKHRLWELFLVTKLGFPWDEVHDIAEQLEHIQSESLVQKLDDFLGNPKFDPHGDPIPDKNGVFHAAGFIPLSDAEVQQKVSITGVIDHRAAFLKYLDKNGLSIGRKISVKEIAEYDRSMKIVVNKMVLQISNEVARNILVSYEL